MANREQQKQQEKKKPESDKKGRAAPAKPGLCRAATRAQTAQGQGLDVEGNGRWLNRFPLSFRRAQ